MSRPKPSQAELERISAALERSKTCDKNLHLVVEGALSGYDSYGSWDRSEAVGLETVLGDQLARRVERLGSERMSEVFAVLAPDLQGPLLQAWVWMTGRPYRLDKFAYPGNKETNRYHEGSWLKDIASEILRGLPSPAELAAQAGRAEVGKVAGDAAADYLAAAVARGGKAGDDILLALLQTAAGAVEGAGITPLLVNALVRCERPEGWVALQTVLATAGPEESVCGMIAEHAFEASDDAALAIMEAIGNERLIRRPKVRLAMNWALGMEWPEKLLAKMQSVLEKLCQCLAQPASRVGWIRRGEAELLYLSLWCEARQDADRAVNLAVPIMREDGEAERRLAAFRFLTQVESVLASAALPHALADADLRIACVAVKRLAEHGTRDMDCDLIARNANALFPKVKEMGKDLPTLLWPWCQAKASLAQVKHLQSLKADEDEKEEAEEEDKEELAVETMPSPGMRDEDALTLESLQAEAATVHPPELPTFWQTHLEVVARRYKARLEEQAEARSKGTYDSDESPFPAHLQDLRLAIVDKMSATHPEEMIKIAEGYLGLKDAILVECGMDMLYRCAKAGRRVAMCQRVAQEYLRKRKIKHDIDVPTKLRDLLQFSPGESAAWEVIAPLVDRNNLTVPPPLQETPAITKRPTGRLIVEALNAWLWERREMPVKRWDGEMSTLYEEGLSSPNGKEALATDLERCPIANELAAWWESRPQSLHDADGLELSRAQLFYLDQMAATELPAWMKREDTMQAANPYLLGVHASDQSVLLNRRTPMETSLEWLRRMHPADSDDLEFLLRALEKRQQCDVPTYGRPLWGALRLFDPQGSLHAGLSHEQRTRLAHSYFRLMTKNEGVISQSEILSAYETGNATDSDLAYFVLGLLDPPVRQRLSVTQSVLHGRISHPPTVAVLMQCAALVAQNEMQHAEHIPTLYTKAAQNISLFLGATHAVNLVKLLGSEGPERTARHDEPNRHSVLTHLLSVCKPADEDSLEAFTSLTKQAQVPAEHLAGMAVFAPVWARFVEHALRMPGFEDGIWWLLAHTAGHKMFDEYPDPTLLVQVGRRSPISVEDFKDGAADVAWFHRMHGVLGSTGWSLIAQAAKHACPGNGHMRALVYASAILGEISLKESEQRIQTKRHQDSVRALGLMPLPTKETAQRAEVRRRYDLIHAFKKGASKSGVERKQSEARAAELGLEGLARNAGYEAPVRMEWDLEAEAVREIFAQAAAFKVGDLTCQFDVEPSGKALLTVLRAGKPLKSVPAELRKQAAFVSLKTQREDLQTRATRTRAALEDFMARAVSFTGADLRDLMKHPLLATLMGNLVLASANGTGLPTEEGTALSLVEGNGVPLAVDAIWRVAHPHDLLPAANWAKWQARFAQDRIVQPFKQVFRELYVLIDSEMEGNESRRYEGHVVSPDQALTVVGKRGWIYQAEAGAQKALHDVGLVASLRFDQFFYSPGELESVGVKRVSFYRLDGRRELVPLMEVPPIVFSEVMRDVDLMVSVAWAGKGEPQFSPATLEMRAALVTAITQALKVTHVKIEGKHACIKGKLGSYRVHLGSAVATKSASGMIWLQPVEPAAAEPLFLPFADPDPGSAEVLAKVLLLSADDCIKDADLIKQLRDA